MTLVGWSALSCTPAEAAGTLVLTGSRKRGYRMDPKPTDRYRRLLLRVWRFSSRSRQRWTPKPGKAPPRNPNGGAQAEEVGPDHLRGERKYPCRSCACDAG